MTVETRSNSSNHKSLHAIRSYQAGDVILLEEAPLIRLAPASKEDQACYFAELEVAPLATAGHATAKTGKLKSENGHDTSSSFYDSITVPSSVDSELAGKFRSMVQAAVSYAIHKFDPTASTTTSSLLELYYPCLTAPSEEEMAVVATARQALEFAKRNTKGSKLKQLLENASDNDETLLKVMLIWSCNSFEGGRIYNQTSRINHSCNPNAVVTVDLTNENTQSIVAATSINHGDEITISYLGTMLYADQPTRQDILRRDKHFTCQCSRCASADNDLAARVPCWHCHPRLQGHPQLDEDVQYDDERTVKYMAPTSDGSYACEHCHKIFDGDEKALRTIQAVSSKTATFLRENMSASDKKLTDDGDDQQAELVKQTLREQHLELASSFLGAAHWTTNLLLLQELTQLLDDHQASMLDTTAETDASADMETIAQGIDMLERLIRFVDGLELNLHRGHLLSDLIIGISRALVSLGDVKSKKYAAEWLEKLDDYIEKFESEGMQKVVDTIKCAWKRGDDNQYSASKKLKI